MSTEKEFSRVVGKRDALSRNLEVHNRGHWLGSLLEHDRYRLFYGLRSRQGFGVEGEQVKYVAG